MSSRGGGAAGQTSFDFDFFDRAGWIDAASLPDPAPTGRGENASAKLMKSVLRGIFKHVGKNNSAWPSQETVASTVGCSTKSVQRASDALVRLGLLVVDTRQVGRRTQNTYAILWPALRLRDPEIADVIDRASAAKRSGSLARWDMPTDRRFVAATPVHRLDRSDMVSDRSDMVTSELITNSSGNSPPPLNRRAGDPAELHASDERPTWGVVVSALKACGVSAASSAVTVAQRRELAPEDVVDLVERWQRLQSRRPHQVTPGWLFRWITGDSDPPPDDVSDPGGQRPSRPASILSGGESRKLAAEAIRGKTIRRHRRGGRIDDEAAAAADLRRQLVAAGIEPDAVRL